MKFIKAFLFYWNDYPWMHDWWRHGISDRLKHEILEKDKDSEKFMQMNRFQFALHSAKLYCEKAE